MTENAAENPAVRKAAEHATKSAERMIAEMSVGNPYDIPIVLLNDLCVMLTAMGYLDLSRRVVDAAMAVINKKS
jgi:hypothetical protein